jgi:hypothetical protein
MYYLTFVFQGIVTALHAVWTAVAAGWAWHRPSDVRGLAPAENVAVLSYFLVCSWLLVFASLYVAPWISIS